MLIYPAFVGVIILALTFFLMIYLVPQLASFIKGTGQAIPFQTQLLLDTSNFFVAYWPILLTLPMLAIGAFKIALHNQPSLQFNLDQLKLSIWPTGPVLRKIILARFANSFAMMYRAGISILDCLAHSRDLAGNLVISHCLEQVIHDIEAGHNLAQSFQHAEIFPPLVMRMLNVGETTGQLDQALLNVSYFYDRDVKESIKKVQVLIEPALTLLMGTLLGWITLAVLSPIYDVISKVKM
jgi:type IV pilus assembly protein PilC